MTLGHYLILYKPPRPDFPADATPAEEEIVAAHFDYLSREHAAGRVTLAGRVEDARFGLALLQVETEKEAQAILDGDPAVRDGVFRGTLLPFRLALPSAGAART